MPKRKTEIEEEESINTQLTGVIIQEETTIVLFDVLISNGDALKTVFEFDNLFISRSDGLLYYLFDMKNIVMRDSPILREILGGISDKTITYRGKRYLINWID